jgi:hypothetical protein
VTTSDTRSLPDKSGIKADNKLEAKCRAQEEAFTGSDTYPTAKNGGATVAGVTYPQDLGYQQCNIMKVLLPAMKAAGKKLTWEKVADNLTKTTKTELAYLSDGKGGFGPKKHWASESVHLVVSTGADADTPQDANGETFNGCAGPWNCWVPQLVDGKEWFLP